MARYFVIYQKTGVRIEECPSMKDARELITELEREDKANNKYTPNAYSIEII